MIKTDNQRCSSALWWPSVHFSELTIEIQNGTKSLSSTEMDCVIFQSEKQALLVERRFG